MPTEESHLIARAQSGDTASFEALVQAYQTRVFRMILAIAGNHEDAEDALQETLLQAYRALPRFRGDASFSTWLYRIALNTTRNWLRSQSRASSERFARRLAHIGPEVPPRADEGLIAQDRRQFMRNALLALPDHYRDALLLRHYEDMTYEQIAAVLDIPIGTVRSRIAQARHLLIKHLAASGYLLNGHEE